MDIDILGPLEVRDDAGDLVRLPAGRERALLALLAIERGSVVSVDRIVEALWGERPPGTAPKAVQGYVSHLRRTLAGPGGARDEEGPILTRAPGYVLRDGVASIDAARFEELVAEGRRLMDEGDDDGAARTLQEGLALWRGRALDDFAFDDFAQDEIRRLEELRLGATEDRVDALLHTGRTGGLTGELDALVAANPLRERLRAQAMLALYRAGRQGEALALYGEGRRALADELGVEPGPELQRLQRAILTQDPSLDGPPAPPRPARGRSSRWRWAAAALVALAAVAVAVGVVLARDDSPGAPAVAAPAVVAIDPATNRVVATVRVGSRPLSLAADGDGVWVGDARDGTVLRIDPAARRVVQTIGIGAPALDVAAGPEGVWVATGGFGAVLRVGAESAGVVRRVEPGEPADPVVPTIGSVAVGAGSVWAGTLGGVVRVDPASGRVTARVGLERSSALAIAAGEDAVWATTLRRRAKPIEAASAQVTAEFYAGQLAVPVAIDGGAVWIAAADTGGLWKLDGVTGTTILTTRAGTGANAVAVGEDAVWVGSWADGAVVRVDRESGDVEAVVPVAGEPFDVVVAGGLIWVAIQEPEPEQT